MKSTICGSGPVPCTECGKPTEISAGSWTIAPDGYVACSYECSERAQVSAVAPEAIRMLMEAEWMAEEWDFGGGEPCCGWCGRRAPYSVAYGFIGPQEFCAPRNHEPECPLIALLRKAGAR